MPGRRASADPHLKTRSTELPLAGSPSVRRKSIQSRYNHSYRARKGGPRAANAEDNGGLQYDTRRDSILPIRPTGPSPAASALPSNGGSAGVLSYFNNENDHRQQMGGGYESTGGFRPPPPAPTNLASNVDQGPPVPPKDPPKILPSLPLATSKVDEHGVDQQRNERTNGPTSANSANEYISHPTAPGPHENLSPTPALNDACLPSAERLPPYPKTIESELRWLHGEDLEGIQQGSGDFVRRSLERIGVSQGESDPMAPKSASLDLDAFLSSAKMQNGRRPLPQPPPPGTTPLPALPEPIEPDGPPAYSRVDVLPNGGYINVSEFGVLIFERSVR